MFKKKGQIVPRYLVESVEPKARHLIKFGCDVEITGRKIKALSFGSIFNVPHITHVMKKKNQRTVKGFRFEDVYVVGCGEGSSFANTGHKFTVIG